MARPRPVRNRISSWERASMRPPVIATRNSFETARSTNRSPGRRSASSPRVNWRNKILTMMKNPMITHWPQ